MLKNKSISPAALLLDWYDRHQRDLPWRVRAPSRPDPYAVWLSEIMLQQTGVTTVKAYYEKFLSLWPKVHALAAAPLGQVMAAWAGLGYYARARNLHACAQQVVTHYGGIFPKTAQELQKLPGIGPYTSAAIAAIAFDQHAIVVDGNVERVLSRLFRIHVPLPKSKKLIYDQAALLTPQERAGDFAQAMMDLGSMICTPQRPTCLLCPLKIHCVAYAAQDPERFPLKIPKAERPARIGTIFYLRHSEGDILTRLRPPKGLLGGMVEFPSSEWVVAPLESYAPDMTQAPLEAHWMLIPSPVTHVFTHFALHLHVMYARTHVKGEGQRWIAADHLPKEALPTLMRKVMRHVESWERKGWG